LTYEGDVIHHFKASEASNNIRFLVNFTVREMHKTVHEIRDCKKENTNFERRGKMKK
jgi:hypothetical protein